MSPIAKHLPLSLSSLVVGLLLSACGGGDGSPPPVPTQTSGYAVDGYLQSAAVLCDSDANGAPSVGEVTSTTTSGGLFTFPEGCGSPMVVTGGTNADTGLPFSGTLKAPAGAKAVTPLTTLMVAGLTQDQLLATLGLPAGTDVANTDPAAAVDGALSHPVLMKKTLAVQQLIQKTAEMLNGLSVPADPAALPAIYTEVAAAYADFLKGGRKLNTNDTTLDVAVVGELVKAAATRVGTAPALSIAVRNAAKSVNAGALAGVTAGGLKVQAEALLKATTAQNLTAATEQQQTDTQITEYVVANKAALAGAPTADTVKSLGTALTEQVTASQDGGGSGGGESGNTGTCVAGACIDFAGATVGLGAFGDDGGGFAAIDSDPNDAANKVARIVKKPGDQVFLGASIYTNAATKAFDPPIVLTSTNNTITLRVYSPAVGEKILLKVENLPASGSPSQEVQVSTTKAKAWETLKFTFAGAGSYNTISVLPHFGTAVTAESTFYVDELKRPVPGGGGGGGDSGDIDFSDPNVGLGAFGDDGGGYAAIDNDPTDAANKVAKIVKKPGDKEFLGASVFTNAAARTFDPPVVLTAVNNTITLRVYSPAVGEKILLKVENLSGGSPSQEIQVSTTKARAWETLTFTFPNPGSYKTISILPHFGTTVSAETTFYFDDLTRPAPAVGGPDTTPPVVAISDNVAADTAAGSVTFAFAFSENIGTSFTADDVVVAGGTKGAFALVGGTQATLVVTPPAASKGSLVVSVAAGKFADAAGNLNTAIASAQQPFDTTGGAVGNVLVSFDEATAPVLTGFGGAENSTVGSGPAGSAGKAAKVVRAADALSYAGTSFATARIPFTENAKTMTVRVWSPDAGVPVRLKVEDAADGTKSVETEATVTVASGWQVLTFNFANPVAGTPALNLATSYTKITIFFNFGKTGAQAGGEKTYYFDEVTFVPNTGPDTTPPTVTITDNVPSATATGAVTFTFSFSESVGTTFTADDIAVSGGTKGLFTLASVTQATLVVTPPALAVGTINVSVAAAKFADAAGNLNTAAASAQQAFNTTGGGSTGTLLLSFDEPVDAFSGLGSYGGAQPTVEAGPAGGSGKALKIVKPVDPVTWGGAFFEVAPIPFAADRKSITARVFSTRAGAVIKFKVQVTQTDAVEVAGTPTGAANTWSTVTWNLTTVDAAKSYTTIAITPDADLVTTGQTYFIDDITLAGGSGGPDTTPPTVVITDNVADATATGPVTFTFAFSEAVGTSFTTDDIVVSGGTKGPFTQVGAARATLIVTPVAASSGTINVSVAAGRFSDAAGNVNTAAASALQAFNTVVLPGGTVLVTFDETVPPFSGLGSYGGALPSVETGPAGGAGKALKILKPADPVTWGGVFFEMATAIPFASDRKTITARVNSTRAGAVIMMKVQVTPTDSVEVAGSPTGAANTWSTVTWNFGGLNLSKAYKTIAITPDSTTATTGQSYFIDTLTLAGATAPVAPITIATLDEPNAVVTGFEGCWDSFLVPDPAGGPGKVGKVTKPGSGVPFYCGTTVVTVANGGFTPIPFTATAKTMTVRVWSPTAGIPVRLKVEDIADGTKSVETVATTPVVVGWQTLTFNFANPVAGTPALNLATTYNKATIFFNFGSMGTGETYYFDDVTFVTGTGTNTVVVSFDERSFDGLRSEPAVLMGFGGAENSTLVGTSDGLPAGGGTGKAAKVVKNAGETFAGTSMQRKVNDAVPNIPFAPGATKMSLRVYSSYPPGMRVHMKVEQAGRPDINSEVDAFTTVTNAWETLIFEFGPSGVHFVPSGPGPDGYQTDPTLPGYQPTAQLDVTKVHNKVNIFFDYGLGLAGYDAMPGTRTYYFDDVKFVGP